MKTKSMDYNYTMIAKGLQFNSLKEITKFISSTKTDQCEEYVKTVKNDIVIIGKEQETFFYDEKSKLWNCCTREVYQSFIPDFFNASGKSLMKAYKKYHVPEETNDDDEDDGKLLKQIKAQIKMFDSDEYHSLIVKRTTGKLQDNKFVKKLNNVPYLFPIKDGKIIDLRTLEILDRKKEDYFTFESPVTFVKETPNADRFFSQVHTDKDYREYVRNALGYMLTGDTSAQVFFIWYGKGRNGKSVQVNLFKK